MKIFKSTTCWQTLKQENAGPASLVETVTMMANGCPPVWRSHSDGDAAVQLTTLLFERRFLLNNFTEKPTLSNRNIVGDLMLKERSHREKRT